MWTAQALRAALPALNIAAQPRHQGGQRHLLRHPRRWRPPRPRRPQSQFKMMVRTTGLEPVLSYEKQIFAPRRLSPPPFGVRGLDCPFEIGRAHAELQSLMGSSYAAFCLKKNNNNKK